MERSKRRLWLSLGLVLLLCLGLGCAAGPQQKAAAPAARQSSAKPAWWFHDIVDVAFVQQYAKVPQPKGVMIIDARPKRAKYDKGYIPTAVSIPYKKFDKFKHLLPKDKNTPIIFYCQGYT